MSKSQWQSHFSNGGMGKCCLRVLLNFSYESSLTRCEQPLLFGKTAGERMTFNWCERLMFLELLVALGGIGLVERMRDLYNTGSTRTIIFNSSLFSTCFWFC